VGNSITVPSGFGFTEEHALLRDSARGFLAERCPIDRVRGLAGDPLGHDPGLWKEMAELGWTGLMVPEAQGGAGLGYFHQALLLEETGRCVLPSPLLATTFATLALLRAGDESQRAHLLPGLAAGDEIGTLALTEPRASWNACDLEATAEREGDAYRLRGEKTHVLAASSARFILAAFLCEGEPTLFAVERSARGVSVRDEVGVDPTRRSGRVRFDEVLVAADSRLEGGDATALRDIHTGATALLAAEMVGGAERALIMTRDYAVDRKQFGRQIGSFQAIKHPLVEIMIGVEQARSLVYGAAANLGDAAANLGDGGEVDDTLARMAKASASDVFWYATDRGIQFHGGFGFTIDCDMHFFFKRAIWSRAMLGDAPHHRAHLAAKLLDD